MLIKSAFAAAPATTVTTETQANPATAPETVPAAPAGAFMQTGLFTVALIVLFYFLLIRPQQKRYKEHSSMLNKLGVGDKVVTQGGMVGTIDQIVTDHEVLVDFGGGTKLTVLRSAIAGQYSDTVKPVAKDKK